MFWKASGSRYLQEREEMLKKEMLMYGMFRKEILDALDAYERNVQERDVQERDI